MVVHVAVHGLTDAARAALALGAVGTQAVVLRMVPGVGDHQPRVAGAFCVGL